VNPASVDELMLALTTEAAVVIAFTTANDALPGKESAPVHQGPGLLTSALQAQKSPATCCAIRQTAGTLANKALACRKAGDQGAIKPPKFKTT
jgi:hypothetical protein